MSAILKQYLEREREGENELPLSFYQVEKGAFLKGMASSPSSERESKNTCVNIPSIFSLKWVINFRALPRTSLLQFADVTLAALCIKTIELHTPRSWSQLLVCLVANNSLYLSFYSHGHGRKRSRSRSKSRSPSPSHRRSDRDHRDRGGRTEKEREKSSKSKSEKKGGKKMTASQEEEIRQANEMRAKLGLKPLRV